MPTPSLNNIVITVAYDGTQFFGFQKTDTGRSVESELEQALVTILQHKVLLQAASRTDRGVHASSQIVNFITSKKLDLQKLRHRLNQLLPEDIVVLKAEEAPFFEFHPTLHAKAKTYHYQIHSTDTLMPYHRFTHWHIPTALNLEAMRKACSPFIGSHDFNAFCNQRKGVRYKDTIREISSLEIIEVEENRLRIEITGTNFLYKMARNIAGTLVYVGMGKLQISDIKNIISQKRRAAAGITAPAHGLFLHKVFY